jgi:hypothetical protein
MRRPRPSKGEEFEAPDVGDEDDLELSGFNRFRNIGGFSDGLGNIINENDSYYLRNTTGTLLSAQLNDWGQYTAPEIATRIADVPPGAKRRGKQGHRRRRVRAVPGEEHLSRERLRPPARLRHIGLAHQWGSAP